MSIVTSPIGISGSVHCEVLIIAYENAINATCIFIQTVLILCGMLAICPYIVIQWRQLSIADNSI